jgi:glycosyltransferase involved in cell wall biosynthesis
MKVALSTAGKFHLFDLARELHARDSLAGICTGYPRFKLRSEQLPQEKIHTFPWLTVPNIALRRLERLPRQVLANTQTLAARTFDMWASRNLPECDVFVGLSGSALHTGRRVQRLGGRYVCDRGSAHIRVQERLLCEEHEIWGLGFPGFDPRTIESEEAEYAQADAITVPSSFALKSFIDEGIPHSQVRRIPYGVNLAKFDRVGRPDPASFDILFVGGMSLQKGIPYLIEAFKKVVHPLKRLVLVGMPSERLIEWLKRTEIWCEQIEVVGHIPQVELKHLMSQSHVMVLPSIQEGFGMVMAQAMACGCPVIASENTGARDLFTDGEEGFIVPIRDVDALTQRLQQLADDPQLRDRMGERSLGRVKHLGGWSEYGALALQTYQDLVDS